MPSSSFKKRAKGNSLLDIADPRLYRKEEKKEERGEKATSIFVTFLWSPNADFRHGSELEKKEEKERRMNHSGSYLVHCLLKRRSETGEATQKKRGRELVFRSPRKTIVAHSPGYQKKEGRWALPRLCPARPQRREKKERERRSASRRCGRNGQRGRERGREVVLVGHGRGGERRIKAVHTASSPRSERRKKKKPVPTGAQAKKKKKKRGGNNRLNPPVDRHERGQGGGAPRGKKRR